MLTEMALAYDSGVKEDTKRTLDARWAVKGNSVESLSQQMRLLLETSGAKVVDVVAKARVAARRTCVEGGTVRAQPCML